MNYRANYNSDVAYLKWFQDFSGKTTNASQADLFVVPYPHWSHCICVRNISFLSTKCPYGVPEMKEKVLDNLAYYEERKERHLFLFGVDWKMVRPAIRTHLVDSMTISLGPTCPAGQPSSLCGHLVTPYVDTFRAYQPRAIQPLEWWTHRDRTFALSAAVSTRDDFDERIELIVNQSTHLGDSVGGLPYRMMDLMEQRRQVSQFILQGMYNESIFCPILWGDACPQKRFFDVILNGCIPLVPSFTPSDDEGFPTFFRRKGSCSVRRAYPWSKGAFFGDEKVGVDYTTLVVQYDGTCGLPCMKPAMEKVFSTELTRIRTDLRNYARLVAFGAGNSRYKSLDGFSAMLVAIRHYLSHLVKP
jgi:hypothetical protein